jgi:hypothetical protein
MSNAPDFRREAARVARQAGKERDANEAQRLMSIAEYWVKLAEIEDWQGDNPTSEKTH